MLDILYRTLAQNVRESSDKLKDDQSIEWADISPHSPEDADSFGMPPAYAYLGRSVPDDRSQPASESLARKRSGRVAQRC